MNNYTILHCHTMMSNATTTLDSVNSYDDYIELCKQNNMKALAITEHGNILSWYNKKEHIEKAGMKYIHAIEAYITEKLDEKIRDNRHCIIIAKNYNGFLKLNELVSKSFNRAEVKVLDDKERMYYQPRISLDELLSLDDDFIITSACLGGVLNKKECTSTMYNKVLNYFIQHKDRCYLEIQHHLVDKQKQHNKDLYDLHLKYGIPLVVGTDTHATTQEYADARILLQKRKKIYFEEEEGWDLTFKTYEELIDLYKTQNSIPMEDIEQALENTNLIAEQIETYELDKSFKYPKIYENSLEVFRQKIQEGLDKKRKYLTDFTSQQIKDRIMEEYNIFVQTNMVDFMLLKKYEIDWDRKNGIYCGCGRGSVSGSLIAYLLDITEMNSLKFNLNFFRFVNPSRVTMCDVDGDYFREDKEKVDYFILHDKMNLPGLYTCGIITYNTIALKGAIRDAGGGLNMKLDVINDICDNIDEENTEPYRNQYPELFKYVDLLQGVITSIGSHPAGSLITSENIYKNIGTITLSTSKYPISALNMKEVEALGYLKLDILGLDNVGLINKTCKLANIPIATPDNINLEDENVWDDISKDTTGIFQMESELASKCLTTMFSPEVFNKIITYSPNISKLKLMSFVNGLIRPGCASFRDDVIQGNFYNNGLKELNDFLGNTLGRMVMQEDIMMFLVKFCGYSMAESDNVRRAIAKKKGTEQLLPEIEKRFIDYTSEHYNATKVQCSEIIKPFMQAILDASNYAFSWNHSDAYSFIGYACGYLRHYYPLEFITAALNISDTEEKIAKFTKYAESKGIKIKSIKFGKSIAEYQLNKDEKCVYQGLSSIKYLNSTCANELYNLAHTRTYTDFYSLLKDIVEKTSTNSKQLMILIKLGYFEKFGNSEKLLKYYYLYDKFYNKKTIKKTEEEILVNSNYESWTVNINELAPYCEKETEKQYSQFDSDKFLKDYWNKIENKDIPLNDLLISEKEYLGYVTYKNPKLKNIYMITDFKTPYSKSCPTLEIYSLEDGQTISCKVKDKYKFEEHPFGQNSIIEVRMLEQKYKNKKEVYTEGAKDWSKKEISMGYRWVKSTDVEWILSNWNVIKQ